MTIPPRRCVACPQGADTCINGADLCQGCAELARNIGGEAGIAALMRFGPDMLRLMGPGAVITQGRIYEDDPVEPMRINGVLAREFLAESG